MPYRFYNIDPLLRPFVQEICAVEEAGSIPRVTPVRVVPDTCVELFLNFGEPQRVTTADGVAVSTGQSFVTARMNRFMEVRSPGKVDFISICFFGGSASPFFPVPMRALTNQIVDLRDLWGTFITELEDQVRRVETTEGRVCLIQQYLIRQLRQCTGTDQGTDFVVAQIRRANGRLSLAELADRTGISNRQLVRRFDQHIGLSPKEFARMITFLHALKGVKQYPTRSLTEIAYESSYYDQAHFIHACREYTGLSPKQLLKTDDILYCLY